jgi:HK97 family phage portal protein
MARFNLFRNIAQFFEKRTFDDQTWIKDWLRGYDITTNTYAGVNISPESSIKYSAVLACCRIISEGIASVPLFTYKRLTEGKEKATSHPLYYILHTQPNMEMTSFTFREMMMLHILLWGNFYAEIEEDGSGNVVGLWPLMPWKMTVKRINGKIWYFYRLPDGSEKIIPSIKCLHIPGLSLDGLYGKSIISQAREAIGLGLALEEFGAKFFGQGTQFGGFIEHPKTLGEKPEANLRAALKEKYQGISNAHRIIILEEGMKFSKNIIPPNDAQFLESRKFQKNEIAMVFNVSPHLIKDLDRATFNNIEHLGIEHVVYTLRPWCVRIEQVMTIKLLSESEKEQYFIEFLLDGLLRGDMASRYAAYAIGRQWGWLSADDVRALENMNPLPDEQGKKYLIPLNMIEAGESPVPQIKENLSINIDKPKAIESRALRSATLKSRLAKSHEGLFREATSRIIEFEKKNILKAADSIFNKRGVESLNFIEYLDKFYKDKYSEIDKRIRPVIYTYGNVIYDSVADEIGTKIDSKNLDKFMDEYTIAFNKRYIGSSKSQLKDTISRAMEEDLNPYEEIENKVKQWEETEPQSVALKETVKIAGAVSFFTYQLVGIQRMIWVNTGSNPCPYCEEMNGQVMGVTQAFKTSIDTMEAEGKEPLTFSSDIFHPPLHNGCVCMLVPG